MNVPPIFPEQIVVPDNVADAVYEVRLRFIRRVVYGHLPVVLLAAVSSRMEWPPPVFRWWVIWLASLVALSAVRHFVFPKWLAIGVQVLLLVGVCIATGQVARELREGGFAVVLVLFAAFAATLYAALCGRDFSFVGQFVLSWLAVSVASVLLLLVGDAAGNTVISGWVLASAWLLYFVYDLAALLTRRKRGEEFHAIADLFRDSLNFVTYPLRVYRHWRSIRV